MCIRDRDNTTQTQLTWTSSDEKVLKVDSSKTDPVLEAVGTGKVTLTAVVTKNPSVKTSFDVEVVEGTAAASDLTIDLSTLKIMGMAASGENGPLMCGSSSERLISTTRS